MLAAGDRKVSDYGTVEPFLIIHTQLFFAMARAGGRTLQTRRNASGGSRVTRFGINY